MLHREGDKMLRKQGRLARHLDTPPDIALTDLGHTLSRRRAHLNHRQTLIVDSVADARDQLLALAEGGEISTGRIGTSAPKLAFVCSGMGPQWWRMCRGLFGALPAFTDTIERCDRELSQYANWSLIDELLRDEASSRLGETEFAQPANFAVQLALAELEAERREQEVSEKEVAGYNRRGKKIATLSPASPTSWR